MWTTALRILLGIAVLVFVLVGCQTIRHSGTSALPDKDPSVVRLGTYNVHYIITGRETGAWSLADWDRRKGPLDQAFKALDADIVGFQEMESFNRTTLGVPNLTLDWLIANNPDYAAAVAGDPRVEPSTQPIFYRRDRFSLLDEGWFFFSETPDVLYARTFNGSFPAFASWAQFRDTRSGRAFRVLNMHTDFASRSNRRLSAALVAERISPWISAGETVFILGDMNARQGERTLQILQEVGVAFAPIRGATFHFNKGVNLFGAIDHIGVAGPARLHAAPVVLRKRFDGEWPSDHYPVVADYKFDAE